MRSFFISLLLAVGLLTVAAPVMASDRTQPYKAVTCDKGDVTLSAPLDGNNCIPVNDKDQNGGPIILYLRTIIKYLSGIFGIILVLMVTIAGVQYTTSAGNPQAIAAAKSRLTNALIGLLLFVMLVGILEFLIPGGVFR